LGPASYYIKELCVKLVPYQKLYRDTRSSKYKKVLRVITNLPSVNKINIPYEQIKMSLKNISISFQVGTTVQPESPDVGNNGSPGRSEGYCW